jgi:hypothetical protein
MKSKTRMGVAMVLGLLTAALVASAVCNHRDTDAVIRSCNGDPTCAASIPRIIGTNGGFPVYGCDAAYWVNTWPNQCNVVVTNEISCNLPNTNCSISVNCVPDDVFRPTCCIKGTTNGTQWRVAPIAVVSQCPPP